MPKYKSGFTEEDFDRLKAAVERVGQQGSFDANDLLAYVLEAGVTNNAGDVAAALDDLADLGYLQRLGGDPPRWQLSEVV
jgi:hypothetical protein